LSRVIYADGGRGDWHLAGAKVPLESFTPPSIDS
jgi:hypothetical protein